MNKLIDKQTIQRRVKELGKDISDRYEYTEDLILLCVLKGSIVFMADLMREITIPYEIEFIRASSYQGFKSSGFVDITYNGRSLTDKDVLIIEDIADSGKTLSELDMYIAHHNPKSIKTCVLLKKRHSAKTPNFQGFTIESELFLVGYGLDRDEEYRWLDSIWSIENEEVNEI